MALFGVYDVEGYPGFYIVTGGRIRGKFYEAVMVAGKEHAEQIRDARERLAMPPSMRARVDKPQHPSKRKLLEIPLPPKKPEAGTIWVYKGETYILSSKVPTSKQTAESNVRWIQFQQGRKTYIEEVSGGYLLWVSKKRFHSVRREAVRKYKKSLEDIKERWGKPKS
jgi:hypothetical protein